MGWYVGLAVWDSCMQHCIHWVLPCWVYWYSLLTSAFVRTADLLNHSSHILYPPCNSRASDMGSLAYQMSRERRETLFEDRTRCHADHVGLGLETTAAVAVLKAVHFGQE